MSYPKLFGFVIAASLLLTACGGGRADTNKPVDVRVALGEFTVKSSVTDFKAGVPYRFIVTNAGVIPHEFMIMPVPMAGMEMSGMSMQEQDALAFMVISQEKLPPGATAEMVYTFASVPNGKIEFVCALPGHHESGQHSPITVQ